VARYLVAAAAIAAMLAGAAATAAPPIREAYRVVVEPSGTLLVADGAGGAGRVFRVDPRTGRRVVVAGDGGRTFRLRSTAVKSSLGRVTDVATRGGLVYVVASSRLVRIDRRGRPTLVARLRDALSLAVGPDGAFYVTDDVGGRIVRIRGGVAATVATGFSQPIGIAVSRAGAIYVSSGHDGGRVERIDPDGRRSTVLGDLKLPVYLATAPDGSLLVVDHVSHTSAGTLLRLAADGSVTTVATDVVTAFSSAAEASDGAIYVTSLTRPGLGRLEAGRFVALPAG
jgi:sugar lactone lactonase YvrE